LERLSDAATICYGTTRRVESLPQKALAEREAGEAIEIVTPTGGKHGGLPRNAFAPSLRVRTALEVIPVNETVKVSGRERWC
jgi:hypothetical protein